MCCVSGHFRSFKGILWFKANFGIFRCFVIIIILIVSKNVYKSSI